MKTYCRLKNGKILTILSNNTDARTIHLKERVDQAPKECIVPYSEVDRIEIDLQYLKNPGEGISTFMNI